MNYIFVTGHRPDKLYGYNMNDAEYTSLKDSIKKKLIEKGAKEVYTVLSLGIGLLTGQAVLELKDEGVDIRLNSCIPFDEYEKKWNALDLETYKDVVDKSDKVLMVTQEAWKSDINYIDLGNKFMAEECLTEASGEFEECGCIAVINSKKLSKTNTANCIKYVEKCKIGLEKIDIFIEPEEEEQLQLDINTNRDTQEFDSFVNNAVASFIPRTKEETKPKATKGEKSKKAAGITLAELELWRDLSNYVVIDLETTGYSANSGSTIIDIGAFEVKDGIMVSKYEQLVNPGCKIPANIAQLTGITDAMVSRKPPLTSVFPTLVQYVGNKTVIMHNSKFDYNAFIHPLHSRYYHKELNWTVLCTMKLAKAIVPTKSKSLPEVYKYITGKEASNQSHRASADALMTTEIALNMSLFVKNNFEAIKENLKL